MIGLLRNRWNVAFFFLFPSFFIYGHTRTEFLGVNLAVCCGYGASEAHTSGANTAPKVTPANPLMHVCKPLLLDFGAG